MRAILTSLPTVAHVFCQLPNAALPICPLPTAHCPLPYCPLLHRTFGYPEMTRRRIGRLRQRNLLAQGRLARVFARCVCLLHLRASDHQELVPVFGVESI